MVLRWWQASLSVRRTFFFLHYRKQMVWRWQNQVTHSNEPSVQKHHRSSRKQFELDIRLSVLSSSHLPRLNTEKAFHEFEKINSHNQHWSKLALIGIVFTGLWSKDDLHDLVSVETIFKPDSVKRDDLLRVFAKWESAMQRCLYFYEEASASS